MKKSYAIAHLVVLLALLTVTPYVSIVYGEKAAVCVGGVLFLLFCYGPTGKRE